MNKTSYRVAAFIVLTALAAVPIWAVQQPASAAPEPPKSWAIAMAETIMKRNQGNPGQVLTPWSYWKAYTLYGFEMLYKTTGDKRYLDFIKRQMDPYVDRRGNLTNARVDSLDNIMAGTVLMSLYEHTKDERYKTAAAQVRRVFDTYPRNPDGGFWHNPTLTGEMWIDGVFMGQMFLVRYGKVIGDSEYCYNEAVKQITVYAKNGPKGNSGLYVHAWAARPELAKVVGDNKPKGDTLWADPKTGRSSEVWSEGLGWYALLLPEALAVLPETHPGRAAVLDIYKRLAAGLKHAQDPKTGGWFQVVDKGDRPDNWIDSSGSAMFTYCIQKGIDLGLLSKNEYGPVAERGYKCVTGLAKINNEGLVDIYSACDGLCVQANYAAYINFPKVVNAKESVAGFLWATAIVEKPRSSKP